MPKTMTLINCVPTKMTRIKNYVPNQKTMYMLLGDFAVEKIGKKEESIVDLIKNLEANIKENLN